MTLEQESTTGTPETASLFLLSDTRRAARAVLGLATLALWLAFMVLGLIGFGGEGTVQIMSDLLVGVVVLAGIAGLLKPAPLTIAGAIAAVLYVVAWRFIGWNLLWGTSDAFYYLLVATFYVAPLATGTLEIVSAFSRR